MIKLGRNDTKPHDVIYHNEFAHDMKIRIDNLRSLPSKPEIYLCYPGKIYQTTWGINDSIITNCIIPTIDHLAETNTLNIIDLHSATDNMKEHFKDNVHPDSYVASVIAKTAFENIRCKMGK